MGKEADYYLALSSPWTYIGGKRLTTIASSTATTFKVKPVKGAEVFEASGSLPLPKRPPSRKAYRMTELRRWRRFLDLQMNLEPNYFPVSEINAAHMVIAAGQEGLNPLQLSNIFLACVWEKNENIADTKILIAAATENGFDGPKLAEMIGAAKVEDEYERNTQEAIKAQVFGMPWYIYEGEPYWGQDRLDFLERDLSV